MNSKQIFVILAIVAALSTFMIAKPVMAQNMTGGNMTGGNMTGKVSSVDPLDTNPDFLGRSECPVDSEGIERCPPPQDLTESTGDTNGNGNSDASGDENDGNSDASGDENEDSSNGNENGDNQ